MDLDLAGLTLDVDGVRALDGLTARLRGHAIGLLGANGSGKTSLLRILAGLTAPTAGRASLDGTPVSTGRHAWVSYLPQETGFFPFLQRPGQTLRLSMQFRGFSDPDAPRRILDALGLGEEDRSADSFSGGMKQKLRIAQALVHAPRLLLLDEPTTGLDVRERFRVLRLLERLQHRVGVIFSTHQAEDVAAICDQVLVLRRGRAAAAGTPADIARLADGQVSEITVTEGTLPVPGGAEVVAVDRRENGRIIRLVGAPPPGARPVPARFEDAYVLITMDE